MTFGKSSTLLVSALNVDSNFYWKTIFFNHNEKEGTANSIKEKMHKMMCRVTRGSFALQCML